MLKQDLLDRLDFLCRVVRKEARYLQATDALLFAADFTVDKAGRLDQETELAERVEAFVARFGRLQDTLGDKLLPLLLGLLGERTGAFVDNLEKAERLGLVAAVDEWLVMRQLRNQMIHEYIEDPEILVNALNSGHGFVASLLDTAQKMLSEIERRLKH